MKSQMDIDKNTLTTPDISITASMLQKNVEYFESKYGVCGGLSGFSRNSSFIAYAVLPGCSHLVEVAIVPHTSNFLEEVALAKLMGQQMIIIIAHLKLKQPKFAAWVQGCFVRYLERLGVKIKKTNGTAALE